MFRRNPTRIDLKLDDMHEYEAIKKELEEKKNSSKICDSPNTDAFGTSPSNKNKQAIIHDRIGYRPQPKNAN